MSSNEVQSPSRRTRKDRKAATRRALVEAARRCFARRGYLATQIADIAGEASVAHGTFYVHFTNKEALLEELLDEFNEGLVAELESIRWASLPGDGGGLDEPVRLMARTFLAYWQERRDFVRAYAEKAAIGTSLESLRDGINPQMVAYVSATLGRAGAELGLALPHVELITHGLLAMWMRLGMQALFNEQVSPAAAEQALVTMTLGVLAQAMGAATRTTPEPSP